MNRKEICAIGIAEINWADLLALYKQPTEMLNSILVFFERLLSKKLSYETVVNELNEDDDNCGKHSQSMYDRSMISHFYCTILLSDSELYAFLCVQW